MSGIVALALRLLLALALYIFLGWALFGLWREINQEANKVVRRRVPGIGLTIRAPDGVISMKHFIQLEIILGRDPACDLPILDETVSARHARLTFHHNQWWIEDLNSMNGTRLNHIFINSPTVLTSSDEIDIGQVHLDIELASNESLTTTRHPVE